MPTQQNEPNASLDSSWSENTPATHPADIHISVLDDLKAPSIANGSTAMIDTAAVPALNTDSPSQAATAIAKDDPGVELPIGGTYFAAAKKAFFSRVAAGLKQLAINIKHGLMQIANRVSSIFVALPDDRPLFTITPAPAEIHQQVRPTVHVINMLGEGGEAKIYRVKVNDELKGLKVFRTPHDDIYKTESSRAITTRRISEYVERLAEFPKISARVVAPQSLAYDRSGKLVGYTMDLIQNSFPLTELLTPDGCDKLGLSRNEVIEIFLDLHDTVKELHSRGVVIGDFRPENVLVTSSAVYIVDAESMQFGRWKCHNYTPGWVDPKLCEPSADGKSVTRTKDHYAGGDWYAYTIMLFQALTGCPPYGGTLIENDRIVPESVRSIKRLSVFCKNTIIPHFSLPLSSLSNGLQDVFRATFGPEDLRAEFPRSLLEQTFWDKCFTCHQEFCGATCPGCGTHTIINLKSRVEALKIEPIEIKISAGQVPLALQQRGASLDYLLFDAATSSVVREDETVVGQLSTPRAYDRYIMLGSNTALIKGRTCCVLTTGGENLRIPNIDAGLFDQTVVAGNERWLFFVKDNQLMRLTCDTIDVQAPQVKVCSVDLGKRRCALWAGARKGLLLADDDNGPFDLFVLSGNVQKRIENLPEIHGRITAADACFSDQTIWLTLHTEEHGRTLRYLVAVDMDDVSVRAWTKGSELNPPIWLERVDSKAAYEQDGACLMAATSAGLFRIKAVGERLVVNGVAPDIKLASDLPFIVEQGRPKFFQHLDTATTETTSGEAVPPSAAESAQNVDQARFDKFDFNADAFLQSIHNQIKLESEQTNQAQH